MRGLFPFLAFACALGAAGPSSAQDAGPDPCDPRCEGDTLHFCDGDTPATLDCRAVGTRCALLSEAWGEDCVLGMSAQCDPGYAFGASRCDRAASLYCIEGICAEADGPVTGEEDPEQPTGGTEIADTTTASDPFGCSSCGTGQAAALLPALVLLRLRRRERAGARRGR